MNHTELQSRIIRELDANQVPMLMPALARAVGADEDSTSKALRRLRKARRVHQVGTGSGAWRLTNGERCALAEEAKRAASIRAKKRRDDLPDPTGEPPKEPRDGLPEPAIGDLQPDQASAEWDCAVADGLDLDEQIPAATTATDQIAADQSPAPELATDGDTTDRSDKLTADRSGPKPAPGDFVPAEKVHETAFGSFRLSNEERTLRNGKSKTAQEVTVTCRDSSLAAPKFALPVVRLSMLAAVADAKAAECALYEVVEAEEPTDQDTCSVCEIFKTCTEPDRAADSPVLYADGKPRCAWFKRDEQPIVTALTDAEADELTAQWDADCAAKERPTKGLRIEQLVSEFLTLEKRRQELLEELRGLV